MHLFSHLPQSDVLAKTIAEIFSQRVQQKATPGIRFALFDRSGTVLENGFGDVGAHPLRSHTRFRIASCTKSFTAAAILLLRDRGRLSLDEPVTRYVPALRPTLPIGQPTAPTLRMLLSMAGGLPTDDPWADRQESLSNAALDAILDKGVRFVTTPGTRYEYANLGYALLGRVIEIVGEQSYPAFVTDNLLAPLDLHETGFDPATVPADRMATGFRKTGDGWQPLPFTGPGAFSAIGGCVTTVGDLVRWADWLSAAFRPEGTQDGPLSAATRREMQSLQCAIAPEPGKDVGLKGYGYGLVVEQHARFGPIISHSGGYPGFSSHMRWNAQTGLGVVAFENATYSGAWEPASAALSQLLDAAFSAHVPAATPPAAIHELVAGLRHLLLDGWDDAVADAIFLENVALDQPYAERAADLANLRARAGAMDEGLMTVVPSDPGGADGGFGRFEVHLPCAMGDFILKAFCGPPQPLKIQSVTVSLAERHPLQSTLGSA
ncbi:serine hydrolase domain-containing protein [Pararhizobium sp. O133]|uniref:serine hydrolase domain-containing protein n=1 Tax=Pararhizobium sp. O133 TaxID=3449278 RepID=UPI003F688747